MTQKWLLAIWVMVSFVLAPAIASAQTFHSPNGYSITAPSGWSLNKSRMMGSDIIIITKPEQKFANNLNVRITPLPAGVTLEQVQAQIKPSYQKQFPGYKFISEKFTTVGGQRAYELICNHSQGTPPRPLWARQDMVLRGNKLYIFTCTALTSNAARYAGSFSAILRSVRWTSK